MGFKDFFNESQKEQLQEAMRVAKVTFQDGSTLTTDINGTDEEIKKYYMGKYFNVGTYPKEKTSKVVKVEMLK